MTSLFRPFFASLLCSMIVLGHAPAWLHVVTCDSGSPRQAVSQANESNAVCSHGAHHHPVEPVAGETVSDAHHPSRPHQHDSDTCLVCQSLAVPAGVTWELGVALPAEFVSEPAFISPGRPLLATLLSVPQPRGPPAVA